MHNATNRTDAISFLETLLAMYRGAQGMARDTFGPIQEAWQARVENTREQIRLAIFYIRESEYEGWAE